LRACVSRVAVATALVITTLAVPMPAAAASNQGLNGGWVVGDTGAVSFPHSLPSQLPIMQEAGAGWVRVNFRLGDCYRSWTDPITTRDVAQRGCDPLLVGHTALQAYDVAIDAARARNLQVLGLLSNEVWHGDQIQDWQANNTEVEGGNGDNRYIHEFADAAGLLAKHFDGRVAAWEVWNEPNAWEFFDDAGHIWGSSFIYPSNFAWLLTEAYQKIKAASPAPVISGAVLGTDIGGVRMNVVVHGKPQQIVKHGETPRVLKPTYGATCSSSVPSGADYLCDTYHAGIKLAGWTTPYPFDQVGQHFYIDLGLSTKSVKIASFLEDVHRAYVAFEGAATPKQIHVTEFGWIADPASSRYTGDASLQAENLRTAYTTLANASFVARGYWFAVQDIEEAGQFFGLVRNNYRSGDTSAANLAQRKPAFANYQQYAR
jgi:hypothetical protein